MGLLDLFKKNASIATNRPTHANHTTWIPIGFNGSSATKPSMGTLESKAFGDNPIVYMVTNRIAKLVASVPFDLTNPQSRVNNTVPEDLQYLIDKPNQHFNWQSLIHAFTLNYLVTGNGYIVATNDPVTGAPAELVTPIPSLVLINGETQDTIKYYTVNYFDRNWNAIPDDVLHLHDFNLTRTTHKGFSALDALNDIWNANNAINTNEWFIHKRKGVNGILFPQTERPLMPEERQKIQQEINADVSSQKNAGHHHFSPTKVGYLELGKSLKDLMGNDSALRHLRTICAAYDVPSQVFGDTQLTYSNMEQAQMAMYKNAILPLANKVYKSLTEWLVKAKFGNNRLSFVIKRGEIDEIAKIDSEKSNNLIAQVNAGIITPEEARSMLHPNLDPINPT